MGVSKPQEYCQELQLAVGQEKLSGGYETCRLANRNEVLNLKNERFCAGIWKRPRFWRDSAFCEIGHQQP